VVDVNKSKASLDEVGIVGCLANTVIILAVRIERKNIVRSFCYFIDYKFRCCDEITNHYRISLGGDSEML
jgi:prepilin signal peptidase PulO-like enzyme (type II secretory pathway)